MYCSGGDLTGALDVLKSFSMYHRRLQHILLHYNPGQFAIMELAYQTVLETDH